MTMTPHDLRNLQESYQEMYQLDEISQKTATRAYAASSTGEFEGQDSPRDVERTDRLRKHIERKFGKKAAKHADRAAHSMTFGRKGAGGMPSVKESFDLFDIILDHLISEGYADNAESALVIMANMSEEWKQSIVENL